MHRRLVHGLVPVTLLVGTVLGLLLGALDGLMLIVMDDGGSSKTSWIHDIFHGEKFPLPKKPLDGSDSN